MAYHILKNMAGVSRMTQAYFNARMETFGLGAGQQFFMDRIARYPGLSMAELSRMGFFDNCTATRAVRRLAEAGYRSLVFKSHAPQHEGYMEKVGYKKNERGEYVLSLSRKA